MHILANVTSLRVAGGRSVALNLLKGIARLQKGDLTIVAPPNVGYEELDVPGVTLYRVPELLDRAIAKPVVDAIWLRRVEESVGADVVLTLNNFGARTVAPQLVLVMWPWAMYPRSIAWERLSFQDRWIRRGKAAYFRATLRYADLVATQTSTMSRRLRKNYGVSQSIALPCAVSLPAKYGNKGDDIIFPDTTQGHRLLCLSRYYPHKNIEVFLEVARIIQSLPLNICIITTLNEEQHPRARAFLEAVEEKGLDKTIVNLGEVSMATVPRLYDAVDGLLLPTLLESYSQTYVEAMHYGVPIFTSNIDFAREVCGGVAYFFDPEDPSDICRTITEGFAQEEEMQRRIARGKELARTRPDWEDVAEKCLQSLEMLVKQHRS